MNSINRTNRPIVVGTPLKCGTWLIRQIVADLTGLSWFEPPLYKGINPADPDNIIPRTDAFYSWHFIPEAEIQAKLLACDAKCIFVVRNIYAMTSSMYHHFADNIDWEIGRAANQTERFKGMDVDTGIRRVIRKEMEDSFNWKGIGNQLYQIQKMLEFANSGNGLILSFESLIAQKSCAIKKIADYLEIEVSTEELEKIDRTSDFDNMKRQAEQSGAGSHFRAGTTNSYMAEISVENKQLIDAELRQYAPKLPQYAADLGMPYIVDWFNRCS